MASAADLAAYIARLEQVTARLEKLEAASGAGGSAPAASAPAAPAAGPSAAASPSVAAYQKILDTELAAFLKAADAIGGEVGTISTIVAAGFQTEADVVKAIAACKQPGLPDLQKLVEPVGEKISVLAGLASGRRTDAFNHIKAAAESMNSLTWVVYTGKDCGMSLPAGHVEESWQSAEFYSNKVLAEFRGKDPKHAEWVKCLKELLMALRTYVKSNHPMGPSWNANGGDVASFKAGKTAGPPPVPKAGPPPPPKAPPPPAPSAAPAAGAGQPTGMDAVFAQLNKGEAVTSGLKKVTADMKTKNRTDRTGAVPAAASKAGGELAAAASKAPVAAKTTFELQQGRKWVVENFVDKKDIVITNTDAKQTVYIFGCKNCVVKVEGKVNNITMDKCNRTALVFSDVVAACEIVNCHSVEVQCQGKAPTIAIDNCGGCQLYLSKDSLDAGITTAKSSEVNVMVPGATPEADMVEFALPEQFQHSFVDGSFKTTPVSHSAA
eukprot:jgi/Mesvir1/17117/Mv07550-RA.1